MGPSDVKRTVLLQRGHQFQGFPLADRLASAVDHLGEQKFMCASFVGRSFLNLPHPTISFNTTIPSHLLLPPPNLLTPESSGPDYPGRLY